VNQSYNNDVVMSWIEYSAESDFPIQNLPYGVFHLQNEQPTQARAGVRIGDSVVDLRALQQHGLLPHLGSTVFAGVCF
jgi:fumarylacetoacetase